MTEIRSQNSKKSEDYRKGYDKKSPGYIDDLFTNENDDDKDLVKQFNEAKKERKIMEQNQKLVENRVALFKQEELRILKQIEEIRKKALEIYYLKLKNEEKQKKKELEKEQQQRKLEQQEQIRKQQQKEHLLMIEKHRMEKVARAQKIKEQSKANEQKKTSQQEKRVDQMKEKNKIVKASRELNNVKERLQNQKREAIREQFQKKIENEQEVKQIKEKDFESITNLEMYLQQRLSNAKQMHDTAFDEFESALILSAKEFQEKFLQPQVKEKQIEQQQELSDYNSEGDGLHQSKDMQKQEMSEDSHKPSSKNVSIEQVDEIQDAKIDPIDEDVPNVLQSPEKDEKEIDEVQNPLENDKSQEEPKQKEEQD